MKNPYLTKYEGDNLRNQFHIKIMLAFVIFMILIIGLSLTFRMEAIAVMQTDTLDKLNEISVEVAPVKIEEQPADPVSVHSLSPDERQLVCRVVMSEAGDQGLQAQMAVSQTIYDRMYDWGDTLQKAVKTYSQKDNGAPTDSVKLAVANVFDGGMRVYEGGTYQFHDDSVDPYWTEGKIDRGSIGNLRFYGGYEE